MVESLLQIRDRLMPRIVRDPVRPVESLPAFLVENAESGRVVLTVPLEVQHETADGPSANLVADDFLMRLSGRLVEAGKANQNGAFWSQDDLEFGLPSIAFGPLNWLHDERHVVGVLTDAHLVGREGAANMGLGPHVVSDALMWKWLAPKEAAAVEHFSGLRQAYYSMECISRQVACVGENGCGTVVDYLDALHRTDKACQHIREHSASRRFVSPIFQGAAIIVPPTKPGWAYADLSVQRAAAGVVEKAELDLPGLDQAQVENIVSQVIAWSSAA